MLKPSSQARVQKKAPHTCYMHFAAGGTLRTLEVCLGGRSGISWRGGRSLYTDSSSGWNPAILCALLKG